MTLTLDVDCAVDDAVEVAERVLLAAPHVDRIRVNTVGVGFGLATMLDRLGVSIERYNPAELPR